MIVKKRLDVDMLNNIYWLSKAKRLSIQVTPLKRWYQDLEARYVDEFAEYGNIILDTSVVANELRTLNKPLVTQTYQSLLKAPEIKESVLNQRIVNQLIEDRTGKLVEEELRVISNNLDHIRETLQSGQIEINKYNELRDNVKLNTREKLDLSLKEGINIRPHVEANYYDMNKLFDSFARKQDRLSDYDEAISLNEIAEQNGEDPPYPFKTWKWQMHGEGDTTRHESNDGQTVEINETFTITNDATGDVDELMYPMDSNGSPSNTYYCYCGCIYHNGDG